MATAKAIAWVESLAWVFIFGGCFAAVVGIATMPRSPAAAWTLIAIGAVVAIAGAVLIWVRSRMQDPG